MKHSKKIYLLSTALCLMSFMAGDDTLTKENGVYVINTTEIGKNVEGYNGPTPLKIYINNNKVEKIEAQILCEGEKSPAREVERPEGQGSPGPAGRCRHRRHLFLRGRHQERPVRPRLLPESQIKNPRRLVGILLSGHNGDWLHLCATCLFSEQ